MTALFLFDQVFSGEEAKASGVFAILPANKPVFQIQWFSALFLPKISPKENSV